MTTVLEIATRALRRAGIVDSLHTPSAEDARDTIAALNEMLFAWKGQGVDLLLQEEFSNGDTFQFWVPPVSLKASTIDALSYRGTWDASTNSPALASSTGTAGHVYRVSTAGSTTLDDVASWSVNDYAVFDGLDWLKSVPFVTLQGHVIAMLARRMCDEFGQAVPAQLERDATMGWYSVQGYYVKPPTSGFDRALIDVPSRSSAVDWWEP